MFCQVLQFKVCLLPSVMSLENFFVMSGSTKTRENRKKSSKANASTLLASQNNEHVDRDDTMLEATTDGEEVNSYRDDSIVERVTANIAKMLDSKLDTILKPVTEVSEKIDNVLERLGTVEQRVSDLEDRCTANAPRLDSVETALKKAMERLDNIENQSRRQNVRIVGLKEGIEGKNPVDFFEKWIPEVLGMQGDTVKIERAHRAGPPLRTGDKEASRAVLVRLHNYSDKLSILYAARAKGRIKVEGRDVSFYQDFSAEVVKKRRESANARRLLREAGVKYAFVYPAVIKIIHPNGKTSSLANMEQINNYIKRLPASRRTGSPLSEDE